MSDEEAPSPDDEAPSREDPADAEEAPRADAEGTGPVEPGRDPGVHPGRNQVRFACRPRVPALDGAQPLAEVVGAEASLAEVAGAEVAPAEAVGDRAVDGGRAGVAARFAAKSAPEATAGNDDAAEGAPEAATAGTDGAAGASTAAADAAAGATAGAGNAGGRAEEQDEEEAVPEDVVQVEGDDEFGAGAGEGESPSEGAGGGDAKPAGASASHAAELLPRGVTGQAGTTAEVVHDAGDGIQEVELPLAVLLLDPPLAPLPVQLCAGCFAPQMAHTWARWHCGKPQLPRL